MPNLQSKHLKLSGRSYIPIGLEQTRCIGVAEGQHDISQESRDTMLLPVAEEQSKRSQPHIALVIATTCLMASAFWDFVSVD